MGAERHNGRYQGVTGQGDDPLEALRPLALAVLSAVDEGRPVGDAVRALALGVLAATTPGTAPWLAAVALLEPDPQRVRRAVLLAGEVLDELLMRERQR
jgi:hypothetical protein